MQVLLDTFVCNQNESSALADLEGIAARWRRSAFDSWFHSLGSALDRLPDRGEQFGGTGQLAVVLVAVVSLLGLVVRQLYGVALAAPRFACAVSAACDYSGGKRDGGGCCSLVD